jgi:hypothetical protein
VPPTPYGWGPGLEWSPHQPGITVEPDVSARVEAAVIFPHLSSFLTAPVSLGTNGPTRLVALPNARLDTTASPLIQVSAFHFGPGYGELSLSYRLLATEGSDSATNTHSRLNLQTFSLDYLRTDCPLGKDLVLDWDAGVRLQVAFFDTQAQTVSSYQQARNYFFGAGPHAGVGLTRQLPNGLCLFGRFDAGLIVGYNTTQNFVDTVNDPNLGILSGTADQERVHLSPSLAVRTGLTWTPDWLPSGRLRTGYQFEQWYGLGRVNGSRGDLNAHGPFLSLEMLF